MTDNPGMLHCGSLVPRPSPQKNGGRREPGNIRVKADFRRLDLAEIAEQNHVNTLLFSRRCLHCCANAQIVDTELNAPGQSTYLSKAVDSMCERATGLISLFTVVCLPDQLVLRLSPLTGSTVHKVSSPG